LGRSATEEEEEEEEEEPSNHFLIIIYVFYLYVLYWSLVRIYLPAFVIIMNTLDTRFLCSL
jgi:hypothetical protein